MSSAKHTPKIQNASIAQQAARLVPPQQLVVSALRLTTLTPTIQSLNVTHNLRAALQILIQSKVQPKLATIAMRHARGVTEV
jgi:hypothetical protein